jgi:hypothetical protein
MKRTGGFFCVVASVFLAAYGAGAAAQAVDEVEPNYELGSTDPMAAAQPLTIGSDGTVTVNALLETAGTNGFAVDVFSFQARTDDVVTVDINGGMKSGLGSVDTFLAIQGPAPDYKALSWNPDRSADDWDAYIANYRIATDGVYYVVVTGGENRVADGAARAAPIRSSSAACRQRPPRARPRLRLPTRFRSSRSASRSSRGVER